MHGDLAGLALSVLLIALCLGSSVLVAKKGKTVFGSHCPEVARKIVHIGVSNWFFIYLLVFESDLWPMIGLGAFAVINAVMNITGLFGRLMAQDSKKRNWGLVQYPVSIMILIAMCHCGIGNKVAVGCAVLGMGYGDGLAAIMGMNLGKRKLPGSVKTLAGSLTMLVVTLAVTLILNLVLGCAHEASAVVAMALGTAVVATFAEAYTPFGLDNITVPVVIFLLAGLI